MPTRFMVYDKGWVKSLRTTSVTGAYFSAYHFVLTWLQRRMQHVASPREHSSETQARPANWFRPVCSFVRPIWLPFVLRRPLLAEAYLDNVEP